MKYHDPSEYIRGLQQLLISDKKRIGFLFGAGSSFAKKNSSSITIPAIKEITEKIEIKLSRNKLFEQAINEIKNEIGLEKYNIETFLSNIESKRNIICDGCLNGLLKSDFEELVLQTKKMIIDIVSIHKEIIDNNCYDSLIHVDFAEWIGRANRKYPIEIFTTNYDFMIELGLEYKSIPFYDGFTGSYEPFFNSDSIERIDFLPNQTKLWKIHGSLGWKLDRGKVLRKEPSEIDILVYPSTLKYDNSRKQPYIALMDRLSNFLRQSDTVLIISGYSFGDEHINERIVSSLRTNTLAHVFVFYFDKVWDKDEKKYLLTEECYLAKLAKENSKITVFGCRNAVIGSQYGTWGLKKEPSQDDTISVNLYFDEDGPLLEEGSISQGSIGNEKWTGQGELTLVDFVSFTYFLKSMINY